MDHVLALTPFHFETQEIGGHRSVTVRKQTVEEQHEQHRSISDLVCEAQFEKQPLPEIVSEIESYWQANPGDSAQLSNFSDEFQDFIITSGKQLTVWSLKTMGVLFWRLGESGPIAAGHLKRMEWSQDSVKWCRTPVNIVVSDYRPAMILVSNELGAEINPLLIQQQTEPMGHELLREAWNSKNSHPRSALVIGISALETGLKELIGDLVPSAQWLAMNAPSPPVVKIMKTYLPTLPTRLNFDGRVLSPPPMVHKVLTRGIEQRNQIAHGNTASIAEAELKELLLSIKDVLYLCDYYRGCSWALEMIRQETKSALLTNIG